MKICPTCKNNYPDDANFCPQETCATPSGPQRLQVVAAEPKARFAPQARIGGSSTGEVWRALDTQTGNMVAYKLVAPAVLPTATVFGRAERELKQLMRAQSPKIAAIVDCGKAPDDRLFVAMEMVQGEPLDRLVKSGPLGLEKAKAIVAQIGQALLEAQKAGLVHRDLAPKNVLVAPSGELKLINFALPKPLNDRASGVPAYLSPEQVQGKPVDQRSNTYSLAAIFYHLITGEPPFQGSTEQILELHTSSPALAPAQRRPEANLSPEVDRVILKALDKNSSRRHLTLRLFLQEVEALTVTAPAAAPAGAAPAAGGVGYAKTMLFAGGQAEVASMVAKAIASRGGAAAAGAAAGPVPTGSAAPSAPRTPAPAAAAAPVSRTPAPAPRAASPTPAPVAVAAPAAPAAQAPAPQAVAASAAASAQAAPLVAAHVEASQSAAGEFSDPAARLTPPPVTPFPPMRAAPPAASPVAQGTQPRAEASSGKGAAFRETLWFKKGDVEHMIAEAKAKLGTTAKPAEVEVPSEDVRPLEDRYQDDGSLSVEDRKKFSLRSGATVASMGAPVGHVPGEKMSAAELAGEVSGSRKNLMLIVVGAVVVVAIVAVFALTRGSKGHDVPAAKPAAAEAPAAPPPPPAAPPPAPTPAAAAVAPAPTPAAAVPAAAPAPEAKAPAHERGSDRKSSRRASKTAKKKR